MGFGQFAATTQFYLYGRRHFTSTGYENHKESYAVPDVLENLDLQGRVFMVTGANSGIGKEIAQCLAVKGATVYMVCRSQQRAEAARQEIIEAGAAAERVHVLIADCGLEADVRRCWQEFCAHQLAQTEESQKSTVRLDGLVCNAGALKNEKTLTSEGIEVTFASHFLFGTYLLGTLAMPCLEATPNSRLVVVSSGGMYNTAFPSWEAATATGDEAYDGQFAYAYAKRGQVLLCEEWAKQFPTVAVVSCHPGWTTTPGVEDAYGESKSWLEPLRTPWQGSEGIVWLCVVDSKQVESGAFYLDREPQVKHMAGPFFTEGWATKNTAEEVKEMMVKLSDWSNGRRAVSGKKGPLTAMTAAIDLQKFMGRWYVLANIPTIFDKGTTNNVEDYSLDEASGLIHVDFSYCKPGSSKIKVLKQRAKVCNDVFTQWEISPKLGFYLPLGLAYLVVDCAEDYSTTIIGVPNRQNIWIMSRSQTVDDATMKSLVAKAHELGYDTEQLVTVPQVSSTSQGA